MAGVGGKRMHRAATVVMHDAAALARGDRVNRRDTVIAIPPAVRLRADEVIE
jgi:hypothetical protein